MPTGQRMLMIVPSAQLMLAMTTSSRPASSAAQMGIVKVWIAAREVGAQKSEGEQAVAGRDRTKSAMARGAIGSAAL